MTAAGAIQIPAHDLADLTTGPVFQAWFSGHLEVQYVEGDHVDSWNLSGLRYMTAETIIWKMRKDWDNYFDVTCQEGEGEGFELVAGAFHVAGEHGPIEGHTSTGMVKVCERLPVGYIPPRITSITGLLSSRDALTGSERAMTSAR